MQSDLENTTSNTEHKQWPGAFAAYSKAYEGITRNSKPAMLVVGLYLLITLVGSIWQGKAPTEEGYRGAEAIVGLIFLLALPLYGLAVADKRILTIKQFMKPNGYKYVMVLLTSIVCGLAAALSLLAFIIPVIWVFPWVYLAVYAIAEKQLSPIEAIKYSKSLTGNNKAKVWGLFGVSILFSIGAFVLAIVPVVGAYLSYGALMFISVLNVVASCILYRFLQGQEESVAPTAVEVE